jgi:hypothetical protein
MKKTSKENIMGRMLGSFDGDNNLDRPDLNKCPDCECYFAQDCCPLCGKECPPELRAGNRKPVKVRKRRHSSNGRVTFVEWYHSWWFIIIMLFIFPLVGIVLLITSPHKKSLKIGLAAGAVAYFLIATYGFNNIASYFVNTFDPPVNTKLSKEEYVAKCNDIDAEDYFRSPDSYKNKYVKLTVTVLDRAYTDYDCKYGEKYAIMYLVASSSTSDKPIMIRDCSQDAFKNYVAGDVIVIYGQAQGNYTVYTEYIQNRMPIIHAAYIEIVNGD